MTTHGKLERVTFLLDSSQKQKLNVLKKATGLSFSHLTRIAVENMSTSHPMVAAAIQFKQQQEDLAGDILSQRPVK